MSASDAEDASPEPDLRLDSEQYDDGLELDDSMAESNLKDSARKTESNASSDQPTPNSQGKTNSKDPQRPRRKKARRACFACQRAHLTCGDERPCQRCIKRGLQDACQDGVRKKAKYLHDAPPEALIPPNLGGNYQLNGTQTSSVQSDLPLTQDSTAQQTFYAPNQPPPLDLYSQPHSQSQMIPPLQSPVNTSFGGVSTSFSAPQQSSQIAQSQAPGPQPSQPVQQYAFDPSDPAFFNFDIASLNFGNHYGALEFGMLGHMSSSANDLNGADILTPIGQAQNPYNNPSFTDNSLLFGQDAMMNADWNAQRQAQNALLQTPHNTPIVTSVDRPDGVNAPHAFAIGARPNSLASASPISISQDGPGAENAPSPIVFNQPPQVGQPQQAYNRQHQPVQQNNSSGPLPAVTTKPNTKRKRPYDADTIYDSVKKPYSYTSGFHRLLAYIKDHFSRERVIRIAQALAAVRPSLITFAQGLTDRDLIFMEIGVQRKLYAYDDFIKAYGTPTIIVRRDGVIVAASQEFGILTGWSKAVLLGDKPNLNVNSGGTGPNTAPTSGRGTRRGSAELELNGGSGQGSNSTSATNQSNSGSSAEIGVLVAEIMDQDSVVQFYEDYAKLAFGDPMGTAFRRGKLLKYRTKEDIAAAAAGENSTDGEHLTKKLKVESRDFNDEAISGEAGITKLGEKEGMVDCMYCWNVRRDNFEVPQLIVMNFLPVI